MVHLSNAGLDTHFGRKPSPLVGEGWEGGIAPAILSAPSWAYVEDGIPPSLALPHKGGEDRSRHLHAACAKPQKKRP